MSSICSAGTVWAFKSWIKTRFYWVIFLSPRVYVSFFLILFLITCRNQLQINSAVFITFRNFRITVISLKLFMLLFLQHLVQHLAFYLKCTYLLHLILPCTGKHFLVCAWKVPRKNSCYSCFYSCAVKVGYDAVKGFFAERRWIHFCTSTGKKNVLSVH